MPRRSELNSSLLKFEMAASQTLICVLLTIAAVHVKVLNSQMFSLDPIGDDVSRDGNITSFCPGTARFECVGNGVSVLFEWFINGNQSGDYTFRDRDVNSFPRSISISRPSSGMASITSAARVDNFRVNITSVFSGNVKDLNEFIIQCGSDAVRSNLLQLSIRGRARPEQVAIVRSYVGDVAFSVTWKVSVAECRGILYTYDVELQNATGSVLRRFNETCMMNDDCSVRIDVSPSDEQYRIVVISTDSQGQRVADMFYRSQLLDGFSVNTTERVDIVSSQCYTSATCISRDDGNCEILIGQGNMSIKGQINSSINLSNIDQNTAYSYIATFNTSTLSIIGGNFTTTEYPRKLSDANVVLLVFGVEFCTLTIALLIGGIFCMKKLNKEGMKWKIAFCALILSSIFAIIFVCLIIAFSAHVASQSNTCDTSWQSSRDGIIIGAFVCSAISIVAALIFAVIAYFEYKKSKKMVTVQWTPAPEPFEVLKNDPGNATVNKMGMIEDEKGVKIIEEDLVTSGHRRVGETAKHAHTRIPEERTAVIKDSMKAKRHNAGGNSAHSEENHYDATMFETNPALNAPTSVVLAEEYSSLKRDEGGNKNDKYERLDFKDGKTSTPAPVTLAASNPAEYGHIRGTDSENNSHSTENKNSNKRDDGRNSAIPQDLKGKKNKNLHSEAGV